MNIFTLNTYTLLKILIVLSFSSGNSLISIGSLLVVLLHVGRGSDKYLYVYLLLLVLSILSGVSQGNFYVRGYLLSFITLSPLAFYFIARRLLNLDRFAESNIEKVLLLHVYLSIMQLPIQIFQLLLANNLNFSAFLSNASAGDVAYGSIGHSGVLAYKAALSLFITHSLYSFGKISLLYRNLFTAVLFLSILIVGSNHTVIIGCFSLLIAFIFYSKFNAHKIFVVLKLSLLLISISLLFIYIFESQFNLIKSNILIAVDGAGELPKVKIYSDIWNLFVAEPIYYFLGLGIGSYSSRASFILSGTYLWEGINPLIGFQMSPYFESNLLPLWNLDVRSITYLSGTMFQPFSFYATMLSEYGVIVFSLIILLLSRIIFSKGSIDVFSRAAFIFFLTMLFIDNFMEYLNVVIPYIIYLSYAYGLKPVEKTST